ncbi:hypothetical protein fugu_010813 [Takifugu bimaculatus]|uniref:Uncharacterized protein n=1 Tax=Takifugu bimaculatus TaxID=433685 RepID=A0A4Z2CBA3_9TELE|nr:hypothetical protein fugu_010813 [Takifugu bimaculatus]
MQEQPSPTGKTNRPEPPVLEKKTRTKRSSSPLNSSRIRAMVAALTLSQPPSRPLGRGVLRPVQTEPFEKVQGGASCTGESPVSESERKKPEGEREGIRGEKEGVEGGQVDNQSRKTDKWLHRVSRSRQKVPSSPTGGGQEARCVGRASRQIQISRQRTGRTRAGDEPQLAAPAAEISRAAQAGKKNRQDNICVNGMTGRLSMSTRGGKALKEERFPSTMTWSDLMTPGEDDLGWLHKAPRPAVGGPESKRGVLRRVIDERECFATLRTIQSASAGRSSSCRCAGRRPAAADTEDSLLVVQSLTSLEALRAALQPVCGSSSTGYNAIWNPGEGSVTTFLQCKGCSSQSSGLPAAVVAAEVRYPSDTTRDQIWLVPEAVRFCSFIRVKA